MITSTHNSSTLINYCFSPFQWTVISIQWPSVQITTRHSLSQTKPGYKCSLKFYFSSHTLLWIKTILQNPFPAQASTWHGSPLTHLLYMESFLDIASPIEQGNTASWYYLILVFSIQYWECNFPWLLPLQQVTLIWDFRDFDPLFWCWDGIACESKFVIWGTLDPSLLIWRCNPLLLLCGQS